MSGGDHLHSGTVVGKLEGDRAITLGFVDLMRDETVQQDRSRGVYFTQEWVSPTYTYEVLPAEDERRNESDLTFGQICKGVPLYKTGSTTPTCQVAEKLGIA